MPDEEYDFKNAGINHTEWSTFILDIFAAPLAKFLVRKTKITPNQVTFISMIFGLAGAYFLYLGGYKNILIGASLAFIYIVLDMVDGRIARIRNMCTVLGNWFDSMVNFIIFPALIIGLALGQNSSFALLMGMLAILSYPSQYCIVYFYKSEVTTNKEKIRIPGDGKFEWLRGAYGSNFFYIFLLIGAIVDMPILVLVFWATFGNLYWLVLMLLQYLNIRKMGKKIHNS